MKRFKDRWDMIGLYNICSNYLNNQTENGAILFLEKIKEFEEIYPVVNLKRQCEVCQKRLLYACPNVNEPDADCP
jgi:hypothetical protein